MTLCDIMSFNISRRFQPFPTLIYPLLEKLSDKSQDLETKSYNIALIEQKLESMKESIGNNFSNSSFPPPKRTTVRWLFHQKIRPKWLQLTVNNSSLRLVMNVITVSKRIPINSIYYEEIEFCFFFTGALSLEFTRQFYLSTNNRFNKILNHLQSWNQFYGSFFLLNL